METELGRLRSQNTGLKSQLGSIEGENKSLSLDLQDSRKQHALLKEQTDTMNREFQALILEKQQLQFMKDKLEQQMDHLQENRSREFALIAKQAVAAVEKELESLRVDLKVAPQSHRAEADRHLRG